MNNAQTVFEIATTPKTKIVVYCAEHGGVYSECPICNPKKPTATAVRALSLICLLFLFAGLVSCNTEPVTRSGYPVVNDLRPGKSPWLLTSTSISETAEDLAAGNWRIDSADLKGKHTHFYYAKGDSTRHIITYQGRIVSDKRAAN